MKKLALAMMMGLAAISTNAQMNYKVQTACHPLFRYGKSNGSGRNQFNLYTL